MHIVRVRQDTVILLERLVEILVGRIVIQFRKEPVSLFVEFLIDKLLGAVGGIRLDEHHISQRTRC